MINYTKFEHFGPKCPVYGEIVQFSGYLFSYNTLHAYMPSSSSFAIHAYLHIYGFIQPDICDKLHQIWTFLAKMSILWDKSSFTGKKVQFWNRIVFYMRTYLLLRLHFMLIITCMNLFNDVYVINYIKFDHFGQKCPVYGQKSSFMGKKVEFFIV